MKILLVHNSYRQRGGEDTVFETERDLMCAAGHEVVVHTRTNDEIVLDGLAGRAKLAARAVWASDTNCGLRKLFAQYLPDVAHFHNTFPLISPAAYYACAEARVAVVQTLHNYRFLCPGATFFRAGKICEDCLGRSMFVPAVAHGCYRDSRAVTGVVAGMITAHHLLKTWHERVSLYIALTDFARRKFLEAGWPDKIVVKPNCVGVDPGAKQAGGDYALFVGRFSEEKGLDLLLAAWNKLRTRIPLRIVGDGPLRDQVGVAAQTHSNIVVKRCVPNAQVPPIMHAARFLVFPSLWYEAFPMTIAEAYACGLPVIASALGAMAEIVHDRITGLHFRPDDAQDLAEKVEWAWTHPREMDEFGRNARAHFEEKYTAERNYKTLMAIYERAVSTPVG